MNFNRSILLLLGVFIVFSCRNKKVNTTPTAQIETEELDTIHIVASRLPEKKEYQSSNPLPNDLVHTKLEVDFNWQQARLNGKATLKLRPYFYPVTELALNARGMDILKVEVFLIAEAMEGKNTQKKSEQKAEQWQKISSTYKYDGDSLKITLGKMFYNHEFYYVVIEYVAKPDELPSGGSAAITEDKGLYFINPLGENPFKMPQVWTQGETQSSSAWFPTIDSPNEKTTQEIFMRVEDKYTTLSNGILVESKKNNDGTRTDHWKLDQPHAPYLAMMAVGEFVKVVGDPWKGKEVSYFVEKEYASHAKAIFAETTEMINFYSDKLGVDYPWEKYAQIVARDYVSGAMENTSATLHGDFMVYQTTEEIADGRKGTAVIAHELFHQWFGDLVTCESWSNLPLNESFATYGEYLWYEYKYGRNAADAHSYQSRMGYIHSKKEEDLIRFYYDNKEDMFDAISYNKGGQVLHMLRKAVGDEAFFASLKKYLENNRFKPVEIHHLRLAFEEVTGRDMNWFFNQWFLAKGRPVLEVKQNYENGKVVLLVEQKQDLAKYPLYKLPLDVDLYINGKPERHRILVENIKDTFELPATTQPQLVNFDAERQLLADVTYKKTGKELHYQYRNTALFTDRLEALQQLEPGLQDSTVFYLFRNAAISDISPMIRKYAISRLEKANPKYAEELRSLYIEIFLGDTVNTVKAHALATVNRRFLNDGEVINLTENALSAKSYAVNAEALNALAKRDPKKALAVARGMEEKKGRDVIFAIAALYSGHGADQQLSFYKNSVKYVTGFDMLLFCASWGKVAQRSEIHSNAIEAARNLELIGRGASKYTKYAVTKALQDLVKNYETRERNAAGKLADAEGAEKATAEKNLSVLSETTATLKKIYQDAAGQ